MKTCTKCGDEKDEGEFKIRTDSGKPKNWCKVCDKKYHKEWEKKNREKINKQKRERYKKNPKKEKERVKKYRERNPEKIKASSKKYRKENKEKIKVYQKKYEKERRPEIAKKWRQNPKNWYGIWTRLSIYNHKRKGFEVNITRDELEVRAEQIKFCPICGTGLDFSQGTKGIVKDNSPTLDRLYNESFIDNQNIMIICNKCNRTKSNRTLYEFVTYCKGVVDRFPEVLQQGEAI